MKPITLAAFCAAAATLFATAPGSRAQEAASSALTPLTVERVERALERRFGCLGCHVIGGEGGRIGPMLDGLHERSDLELTLAMIRDPASTLPGTLMPHQPMPDREAARIANYLLSLPPVEAPPQSTQPTAPPTLAPTDSLLGEALYARHCAACHGDTGAGNGWNAGYLPVTPTAHSDPTLMSERPDDTLFDAIAVGGFVLDKSNRMPAFGELLSPEQIRALVGHIRVLCDCEQPDWAGDGEGGPVGAPGRTR